MIAAKLVFCILLFTLYSIGTMPRNPPLLWFSTTSVSSFDHHQKKFEVVDFRGCYEMECAYVATEPLYLEDKEIGPFLNQNLWVIADSQNKSLSWIFSQQRPDESETTVWISRVSRSRVIPSKFNAEPYLSKAPDPNVAKIVESISADRIRVTVTELATNFHTRNSYSTDAISAARFLETRLNELGCQFTRLVPFASGFSPNVLCEIPGTDPTASMVYIGAHYDSRGTNTNNPTDRAPGADDNGSGTAGLLEILRGITSAASEGIRFRRKISIALWAGEEQGLVGSDVTAAALSQAGVKILAYVNMDMIGFPQRDQPDTLWWKYRSVDEPLTDLGMSLSKTYLGEDIVIEKSYSCCSDQQSFHLLGYAATGVFESTMGTNNPNYHRASDLPDTVNYPHAMRTTQMAAALLLTLAEPSK